MQNEEKKQQEERAEEALDFLALLALQLMGKQK